MGDARKPFVVISFSHLYSLDFYFDLPIFVPSNCGNFLCHQHLDMLLQTNADGSYVLCYPR